jgi:hypothetical protein
VTDDRKHAVIETFDIHAEDPLEIAFGRAFEPADMRNARIVYKDVDSFALQYPLEDVLYPLVIGNIAFMDMRSAAVPDNFLGCRLRLPLICVDQVNASPAHRKLQSNRSSDPARSTSNNGCLAIQWTPALNQPSVPHSEISFQEMNACCPICAAKSHPITNFRICSKTSRK